MERLWYNLGHICWKIEEQCSGVNIDIFAHLEWAVKKHATLGLVDESQNMVPQWPNERFYVYIVLFARIFLRNQYNGKYLTSKNCPKIKKSVYLFKERELE